MAFVLQLFGTFRLVGEEGKSASLPDRARALLAYLAVASSPVPRQMLAELLSAEGSEQEQRTTLRQAVYLVRKATAHGAMLSPDSNLALNDALVTADVRLFQRSIARGDDHSLAEAIELYRAPFLYGEKSPSPAFEEWLSARRSEFLEQALEALQKLARSDAAADHHSSALERARRALRLDPVREDFHRQAMRSLAALGQRGNALRQYEVARRTLADELGVVPERETEALREEIACGAERDLSRSTVDTPTPRGVVDENAQDLGAALVGDRRRLLEAIASLRDDVTPPEEGVSRAGAAAWGDADSSWRGGAERRQLTILLCDLVGSTALSAQPDPEDMLEIVGVYHRCCAEQITKAGGFVAKYLGAAVLGYFGYPQAHEDDAERSVQAGLALIDAVPKLGLRNDPALQVRIGIASGLVVVGDLVGEGVAQEHGVVGDTPNLAARLQALAQPGQVVIAPSTRRLAGGLFEYRGLDRSNLKGLSEPIEAWQVIGARAVESRFEAQHESGMTALVDREEEMELLVRRWRQAAGGDGRVVLLSGEPGIGKSRLTVELQKRLRCEPHAALRYFSSPHHTDSTFHPVVAHLERAAGLVRHDPPRAKLDKLMALLGSSSDNGDLRLLAELLSIPNGELYAPLELSAPRKKEKTLEALVRRLETLSRQRPLLVLAEDVHWIDPSSRELLDLIIPRVARLSVLLIITFRPEFQPPWVGQAHVTTLALSRLAPRDGAVLVAQVAGSQALPDDIAAEVVERSDGVPLFVEEMTKAAMEIAEHDEIRRRTTSTTPRAALTVPATLYASLIARLDRLGPAAKEIAQIGAAIGREFTYELLFRVARKSDAELQDGLDRLGQAGLVFCRGAPPQATFLFKHALVRDAAYGTLLRGARQELHSRVAAMLQQRFPEIVAAAPERLAQHLDEAGFAQGAAQHWLAAGQRSLARSAVREAVTQLRRGLNSLTSLADGHERQSLELDLQRALGKALLDAQGFTAPEAGEAFARARALCLTLGETTRLLPILYGQWLAAFYAPELAKARDIAQELLSRATEQQDRLGRIMGHRSLGYSFFYLGELEGARDHLEQARALYDPVEHRFSHVEYGYDVLVLALLALSLALEPLGYLDQAEQRSKEAVLHARSLGHPASLAACLLPALMAQVRLRDWSGAQDQADAFVALATEQGFPVFLTFGTYYRGWALVGRGETTEGLALMKESIVRYRALGQELNVGLWLCGLAGCYLKAGRTEDALRCVGEAFEVMECTGVGVMHAPLLWLRGELRFASTPTDLAAAEDDFRRAIDVARRQSNKFWQLRASTSLARLWRDQGKRTEAYDLLAPIYGWFTEGFDTPELTDAKALLDRLG